MWSQFSKLLSHSLDLYKNMIFEEDNSVNRAKKKKKIKLKLMRGKKKEESNALKSEVSAMSIVKILTTFICTQMIVYVGIVAFTHCCGTHQSTLSLQHDMCPGQ